MPGRDRAPGFPGRWWSSWGRGSASSAARDRPSTAGRGARPGGPTAPADRAVAAFAALDAGFGVRRTPFLFRESSGRSGQRYAFLWPFARAAAAALDVVELGALPIDRATGLLGDGLACYLRVDGVPPAYDSAVRPPLGPGGDRFYDDNAWVGLDLVRLHRLTGDPVALDRAAAVFAFLVSGWDDDPERPHPGGVAWVENAANTDRNTVSTAPAAQLGYLLDGLGSGAAAGGARAWADRMLAWVHATLRDPADGLYWDHVDARGSIERTKWSYNQGNVVGAELARHALGPASDPSASGVAVAAEVAAAALDHHAADPRGLAGQGLAFNAVFFRNLLDLRRLVGGPLGARIGDTVVAFADEAWRTRCDAVGAVRPERRGTAPSLLDQAAMVEIQALAGGVAGDGPAPAPVDPVAPLPPPSSPEHGNG